MFEKKNYLVLTLFVMLMIPSKSMVLQKNNDINEYHQLLASTGALERHPMLKHVVSVKYKKHETSNSNSQICAGILITERSIATAAHCLLGENLDILNPEDLEIAAGFTIGTFEDKGLQKLPVEKLIIYPDYLPGTYTDDLAIVITRGSFDIIENKLEIATISNNPALPYDSCNVLGFAVVYFKDTKLTQISPDEVKVWPENACSTYLRKNGIDKKGKFCAGDFQSTKSNMTCSDLGSEPIYCNGNAFGLLLLNIGCDAASGYTGVFLDLPFYRGWISSHVEGQTFLTASRGRIHLSKIMVVVVPGVFLFLRAVHHI